MALKLALFGIVDLLLLFICQLIGNKFLSLFFLIVIVLPFLFIEIVIRKFRRDVVIDLKDYSFSITINKGGETNGYNIEIPLNEIKTYTIEFPNKNFTSIKFNFKGKKSLEYSFFRKKQKDEDIPTEKLIENFHLMLQSYNKSQSGTEIILKPSFFATQFGLICIISLSCLFIIAICLHFLYHLKSLPITLFFGLMLIIQLILKYFQN